MIPLLFFASFLLVALSRSAVAGVAGSAQNVLLNVRFRLALAGLFTALLLVVRSVVSGRHPDSR